MYYVYVLYSDKLQKRYIGSTSDLKDRIARHNNGNSPYTSKGAPWKLIYYEAFISKTTAQKEERFLKTGQGRERLKYILDF